MTVWENLAYLRYFGMKCTFWKTANKLARTTKGIYERKICNANNRCIEQYIKRTCSDTYASFVDEKDFPIDIGGSKETANMVSDSQLLNNVIWTMWWQGEKNAPELVRACIASMRKCANEHPVIVLDEKNYQEYVELPEIIMKRYEEGKNDNSHLKDCVLDRTKLSDIIRCALLYKWGGLWCDATVCFTEPISETLFTDAWTTLGQDNMWYIGEGKWSTFFMGCHAGNLIAQFVYLMHIEYFTKKKYWVNYLLIDYFIDIAYKENKDVQKLIDNVKTENKQCLTINRKYNEKVDMEKFNEFMSRQHFHKLSWRWWGRMKDTQLHVTTEDGNMTWFGYLYMQYIEQKNE